jgi:hypothetical protein
LIGVAEPGVEDRLEAGPVLRGLDEDGTQQRFQPVIFRSRKLWPHSEDPLQACYFGDAHRQPGFPQGGEEGFEAEGGAHKTSAQESEIVAVFDQG